MDKILVGIGEAIGTLGGAAVLFVVAAYFVRRFFESWLQTKANDYEANLRRAYDIELARLTNELQRQALVHEVQYRRVDEVVAASLEKAYEALALYCEVAWPFINRAGKDEEFEERWKEVEAADAKLKECLLLERVRLPAALYERASEVRTNMWLAVGARRTAEAAAQDEHPSATMHQKYATDQSGEAMCLLNDLVAAYRKRLGITDDPESEATERETKPKPPATDAPT